MPILLLPLLMVALLILLVPLTLWQRWRLGKARKRAVRWQATLHAWLLLLSTVLFVAGAWLGKLWTPDAFVAALAGLGAGVLLGLPGACLARFEVDDRNRLHYTPHAGLVAALLLVVVLRIALGMWQAMAAIHLVPRVPDWAAFAGNRAALFALAGLLLGFAAAHAWALRWRMQKWLRLD